jgi:hypothetical protein
MQDPVSKLGLNKSQAHSKGTVMRNSNTAARLEEFAAALSVVDQPEPYQDPPGVLATLEGAERKAPRLSLTARRIQIRDQGLRPFRVF